MKTLWKKVKKPCKAIALASLLTGSALAAPNVAEIRNRFTQVDFDKIDVSTTGVVAVAAVSGTLMNIQCAAITVPVGVTPTVVSLTTAGVFIASTTIVSNSLTSGTAVSLNLPSSTTPLQPSQTVALGINAGGYPVGTIKCRAEFRQPQ